MIDLISRQAALEMLNDDELERQADDVFDGHLHRYKRAAQRIVAQLPTIAPVKHGKCTEESRYFHCSECGYGVMDLYEGNYSKKNEVLVFEKGHEWKFCPNCGAKMD